MKIVIWGVVFSCSVLWYSAVPALANEAQAALLSRQSGYRYAIPEHLTPEERSWFQTFQEGNVLSEGWQQISAEILSKTPPDQRAAQKTALDNLGRKIGMEWCRPNSVRKVNSSMLKEWGDMLRTTARKNPHKLAWAIATIDQKVDAVLD